MQLKQTGNVSNERESGFMPNTRRAFGYVKPYAKEAVLAMILLALVVSVDLFIPRLVQVIIDEGVAQQNQEVIINTSLLMIGISVLSTLFMIGNTIFAVRTSRGFEADLREAIFTKIQTFSFGNLDDFTTGQLLTRMTSDLNQIRHVITMSIRMYVRMPMYFIGSISIMVATNPQLSLVMAVFLPIILLLVAVFIRIAEPLFTKLQEEMDQLNQVLQENLIGIRVVKAFVRRHYESRRFETRNEELYGPMVKVTRATSVFAPIVMVLLNLGIVTVIYYGGLQVSTGIASVGQILAFINYFSIAILPVLVLSAQAGLISAAEASARRIFRVLDTAPVVGDVSDAKVLDAVKGRVVFEDVSFSYSEAGGAPALSHISFTAEPGQTVAVLGATGSGKSTLIHLIPRFYDATSGRVTIDGVDVRDVTMEGLRGNIGINLQESLLFSGTIKDNIKYGRPNATDEEVREVAQTAQAHDFITKFPDGYETMVGQRGVNLSGGQKQRIAIARTLLVKPRILILDDSTSAVDVATEAKIETALDDLMKDSTRFVVAQRISTVLTADKILVLENGHLVAEGTHRQLMETSPIYREIYDSQLGGGVDQ
jgi:ATP-binding cassette subfamily B multidrug efflux pump